MKKSPLHVLNELITKEYSRFTLLVQYQEGVNLGEECLTCDDEEQENDSCCDDGCSDCHDECEEDESDDEVETDFDPYEYALLFSTVRIASYLHCLILNAYQAAHPSNENPSFEDAIQWLIQLKIVDEDDLNEIAVLFILLQETVEPCDSHEVLCFTNDIERLPTLPLEQIASIVETGITISQALAKR